MSTRSDRACRRCTLAGGILAAAEVADEGKRGDKRERRREEVDRLAAGIRMEGRPDEDATLSGLVELEYIGIDWGTAGAGAKESSTSLQTLMRLAAHSDVMG